MEKCIDCGYNHDKQKETCEQVTERVKLLRESLALTQTGYAGIDKNGNKVDRRKFPDAIPLQYNPLLNIPHPKPLN